MFCGAQDEIAGPWIEALACRKAEFEKSPKETRDAQRKTLQNRLRLGDRLYGAGLIMGAAAAVSTPFSVRFAYIFLLVSFIVLLAGMGIGHRKCPVCGSWMERNVNPYGVWPRLPRRPFCRHCGFNLYEYYKNR